MRASVAPVEATKMNFSIIDFLVADYIPVNGDLDMKMISMTAIASLSFYQ